jgi:ABC-2 type transport system ATP-binding protein
VTEPVLEYQHINKTYRSRLGLSQNRALQDFNLSIFPGEIVGFLGPNGAGKTTAIHIALGLTLPSSGGGSLMGKNFGDVRSRRRIGFLAENVAFYHRAAVDVVRLYGALNGVREPALSRAAKNLLEDFDLASVRDQNISKVSRGMLQRVGLAQALINDPELLILDEPTSALDPASRITVRNLLVRTRAAGKSVFLSSHLLSELEMVSDRVVILDRGRVVLEGRTQELLESRERCEFVLRGADRFSLPEVALDISQKDGELSFSVPQEAQRQVIESAWTAGAELISVNPVRRTLEEIFLKSTGHHSKEVTSNANAVREEGS